MAPLGPKGGADRSNCCAPDSEIRRKAACDAYGEWC